MQKFSIILIVAASVFLSACKEEERREVIYQSEKCYDKPLTIEMGGYTLQTQKREGLSIRFDGKEDLYDMHMGEKCKIDHIKDAFAMRWRGFSVSLTNLNGKKINIWNDKYLKEAGISDEFEMLENGTKKIQTLGNQLFILPLEQSSAFDQTPVVLRCDINIDRFARCGSRYAYNRQLSLGYSFSQKKYDEAEFIAVDQKMRQKLESMIIAKPEAQEE